MIYRIILRRCHTENPTAYYPYGMPFADQNGNVHYKHGGKELDTTNDPSGKMIRSAESNSVSFNMKYGEVRKHLRKTGVSADLDFLIESKEFVITVEDGSHKNTPNGYDSGANTITLDLDHAVVYEDGTSNSPAFAARHEFDHAAADKRDPKSFSDRLNTTNAKYDNDEEKRVITEGDLNASKKMDEAVRPDNHISGRFKPVEFPTEY